MQHCEVSAVAADTTRALERIALPAIGPLRTFHLESNKDSKYLKQKMYCIWISYVILLFVSYSILISFVFMKDLEAQLAKN